VRCRQYPDWQRQGQVLAQIWLCGDISVAWEVLDAERLRLSTMDRRG
jgi:hypothetical protein